MNNLPSWLPIPRSWLSALTLILLMTGIQRLLSLLWFIIIPIIRLPKVGFLLYFLLFILVPIALVAFIHHWLHRFLDEFFPESRIPDTDPVQSGLPGLMSWWEGFYGWMVNHLSGVVWSLLLTIVLPVSFDIRTLPNALIFSAPTPPITPWDVAEIIVKVIVAACFYQFEYSVQRHLMAAGSVTEN